MTDQDGEQKVWNNGNGVQQCKVKVVKCIAKNKTNKQKI